MLTGSELMKRAQLAEIERLKKITELANQTRRNEITNRAFERPGITTRHPMGDLVLSMVRELANQNLNTGEIVERLNDNETVLESRRLHKEKRADLERQIDEGIAERKRPVLICGKCSPTWPRRTVQRIRLPQTRRSPEHPNGDSPTRHNGKIRESCLTGAESTQKENPRQYGLPNLKTSSASINKAGMSEAIKLVGGRVTEFRTYLYEHRDTGLRADVLARRFMAESMQGKRWLTLCRSMNQIISRLPHTNLPNVNGRRKKSRKRVTVRWPQQAVGKLKEAETNGITHDVVRESQPAPQPALISVEVEQSRVSMQEPSVAPTAHLNVKALQPAW